MGWLPENVHFRTCSGRVITYNFFLNSEDFILSKYTKVYVFISISIENRLFTVMGLFQKQGWTAYLKLGFLERVCTQCYNIKKNKKSEDCGLIGAYPLKQEIESLVKLGILEEVKEHTDWVNSYVIVEKGTGNHHSPNHTIKKELRICLDPRDLNEALEREPYHTHSVDEITAKLQGMTVFTIVDFKKGYWMVVLHPDSRKVTCMALPFGRFQWT